MPGYDLVVQVWSLDGVRIYLSRPHAVLPGLTTLGLSTARTQAGSWRVYGVEADGRVIQVAQPMEVREQRAARLALKTITPFAILVPALALLVAVQTFAGTPVMSAVVANGLLLILLGLLHVAWWRVAAHVRRL